MGVTIEAMETKPGSFPGSDPAELRNHRTQSATAIDGWKSVLMGLPFLAAGVAIVLVALGVLHARKNAPDWLIGMLGTMFGAAGLFLLIHGLRGVIRRRAYLAEAANRPNEPWLFDYHWRREGIAFSAFGEMLKRLMAALVWTAFLTPFAWVGLNAKGGWPFLIAVGFFGLIGLVFWYRWLAMLFDLLRYGNSFLSYSSFPFFLGGDLNVHLRITRHLSEMDELAIRFRCVEEKYVTRGTGRNRSTQVVCYELYGESATMTRERLAACVNGEIPIEFKIPKEQQSTKLSATPPIYWEIEAKGKARGADYEAVFLVPVYKSA